MPADTAPQRVIVVLWRPNGSSPQFFYPNLSGSYVNVMAHPAEEGKTYAQTASSWVQTMYQFTPVTPHARIFHHAQGKVAVFDVTTAEAAKLQKHGTWGSVLYLLHSDPDGCELLRFVGVRL